jgi:hypothetical protein
MPDGITAGPGFPYTNISLGHLHFRTDQNVIYQYQGGTASDINNWFPISGKNIAYVDANDLTGEIPGDTNPFLITFSVIDALNITVVGGTDFTIVQPGTYELNCHSQITKTGGAAGIFVDQWFRLNGVDVLNTGSRNTVASNNDLKVLYSSAILRLNVGDVVRVYIASSSAGSGLGTYTFSNGVGSVIPATEFHMLKID